MNIIFSLHYTNKWTRQLGWLKRICIVPWDLGSIPRSPKPLFLFFHNMFLCRPCPYIPPWTFNDQHAKCLQTAIQRPWEREYHAPSQSQRGQFQKVKQACWLMGLRFLNSPPYWAHHPLVLLLLFIFFSL